MNFRKDINGLRAIAVIAVVLFHFNASWMPGGFVGVDIFFVISGFLMTGIICKGLENNSFSVRRFYTARANRIVPALAVLCFVMLLFGWFFLAPDIYRSVGSAVTSSISFLSNFSYWGQTGYFNPDAKEKWLLHTWSLSTEWQFYIIYPLLLLGARRWLSLQGIKNIVLLTAVIGYIFCVFSTKLWPDFSYYLLPARAWEMLVGGVAFLFPFSLSKRLELGCQATGILLIVISCIFISAQAMWPGYLAIVPAFGAFMVIQSQRNDSLLTGNVVFQKIGLWSYSIYLWHWPLAVFLNYSNNESQIAQGLAVILSIGIGFLSYRYIERLSFFKKNTINIFGIRSNPSVLLIIFLVLLGSFTHIFNGFPSRQSDDKRYLIQQVVMPTRDNGYCFYDSKVKHFTVSKKKGTTCTLGDRKAQSKTLIFGDSFAGMYEPFFDELMKKNKVSLTSVTTNWCYPSLTKNYTGPKEKDSYKQCLLNRSYLEEHMSEYDTLILSGYWLEVDSIGAMDEVFDLIKMATKKKLNVIIMPSPTIYNVNITRHIDAALFSPIFSSSGISSISKSSEVDVIVRKLNKNLEMYAKTKPNVYYIKREDLFSDRDTFLYQGVYLPYSLDGRHISLLGSLNILPHFMHSKKYVKIKALLTQSGDQ